MAEYRTALRLDPAFAPVHNSLGIALQAEGKLDEAIAEYRTALRLTPDMAAAHFNLGNALKTRGQYAEAVGELCAAIQSLPNRADAHYDLAVALHFTDKPAEAEAECRAAIRLKPDYAMAHNLLALMLSDQAKHDEAIAEVRESLRLDPESADAHCNLGRFLREVGRYAESLEELRRGHALGLKRPDWRYPSAQWVLRAERLVGLESRLPAVIKGEDRPKDTADILTLADMAYTKGLDAASTRLWALAFATDPALADNLAAGSRYNAACAAARAGGGKSKDAPPPDDRDRAKLRGQALAWLRADLDSHTKHLETEPAAVRSTLTHWTIDPDLATVREPAALANLPEAERKEWVALWTNVTALLESAKAKPT